MTGQVEFRLLGPLEAQVGGRPVKLGGMRQRALLAALLLDAGRTISIDRLVDAIWAQSPPESVRTQIAIRVHGLRKAFKEAGCAAEVIVTERYGYRLATEAAWVDAREAEEQAGEARRLAAADEPARAAALLGQVLALWRGPVLAELDCAAAARVLEDLRLDLAEEWADLELAGGRPREVVGRLAALVEEHPLREGLRERLMLAMSRSGRQADALESYRQGRTLLLEELGLEPGSGLREAHQAVLRGLPESDSSDVKPAQLPPSVSAFVGRASQLDALDRLRGDERHLPVAVVSGVAGVGKSALALHWAHRVADRFPDGQLFADLRGYCAGSEPARPAEVLERFLRALGVPGRSIPQSLEERSALFRSTLSRLRVLLVLDNADSAAQVRPLLPGTSGCCVVVTSRRRLEGLMVDDGAVPVPLEVLSDREAADLLGRVAGADRVRGEHSSAVRLAALCEGLPLALRIAAAKLATRPRWSLRELADRLADECDRLDQLSGDELEVRGSIELSYRELPARAALAFRLLGGVDAPGGFAPWLVAALLDTTLDEGEALLEDLVDAQLLQPLGRDAAGQPRYRFHDLIRLFAAEGTQDRLPALTRAFGALLALVERARDVRHDGHYQKVPSGPAPRWLPAAEPLERLLTDPMAWEESERQNVQAAVEQCARLGLTDLCWNLVAGFVNVFETRAYYDDWEAAATRALDGCVAAGDLAGQAAMLYSIGSLGLSRRSLGTAGDPLAASLKLFERLGDEPSQATVLRHLGTVLLLGGDHERGIRELERATELFERVGDLPSLAHALGFLSHGHMLEGRVENAGQLLEQALRINPGSRPTEARLLKRVAEVRRRQGRPLEAIEAAERALVLTREYDDLIGQAFVLHALGEARVEAGDPAGADDALREALRLARRMGERMAEGRILLSLGHLHDDHSARYFRQAADVFAAIGAMSWYERAVQETGKIAI